MRKLLSTAVATLFLVGCGELPVQSDGSTEQGLTVAEAAPSAATQHDRSRFPVSFPFTACNGEVVDFSGAAQVVIHSTVSGSGHVNLKIHQSLKASGTGRETGARYRATQTINESETFDADDAPHTFGHQHVVRVIGQGAVPDFRFDGHGVSTVNANGELVNYKFEPVSTCR